MGWAAKVRTPYVYSQYGQNTCSTQMMGHSDMWNREWWFWNVDDDDSWYIPTTKVAACSNIYLPLISEYDVCLHSSNITRFIISRGRLTT
jgi:hypothetical protein